MPRAATCGSSARHAARGRSRAIDRGAGERHHRAPPVQPDAARRHLASPILAEEGSRRSPTSDRSGRRALHSRRRGRRSLTTSPVARTPGFPRALARCAAGGPARTGQRRSSPRAAIGRRRSGRPARAVRRAVRRRARAIDRATLFAAATRRSARLRFPASSFPGALVTRRADRLRGRIRIRQGPSRVLASRLAPRASSPGHHPLRRHRDDESIQVARSRAGAARADRRDRPRRAPPLPVRAQPAARA